MFQPRHRSRHRAAYGSLAALATVATVATGLTGLTGPTAAYAADSSSAAQSPGSTAAATGLFTSFEAGDQLPTWVDTPDTDARGAKKASGVIGASVLERSP